MWVLGHRPAPQPHSGGLYARMRSPLPTWSRALLLLSRSRSTDCSNARAATRLKKAFTFSPGGHGTAVALSTAALTRRCIWVGAGAYEGQGSPPLGLPGTAQCRGRAGWPGFPPGSSPLPTLATCPGSFLKSPSLGFPVPTLPISQYLVHSVHQVWDVPALL